MVVQRDDRATLLNIPDLDDSIPSANNSDRDGEKTCMIRLASDCMSFKYCLSIDKFTGKIAYLHSFFYLLHWLNANSYLI